MNKSLASEITKKISLILSVMSIIVLLVSSIKIYFEEFKKRESYITFVSSNLRSSLAKPLSRGNYFEVEDILLSQSYLSFVKSIEITLGDEVISRYGEKNKKNLLIVESIGNYSLKLFWSTKDILNNYLSNILLISFIILVSFFVIYRLTQKVIFDAFDKITSRVSVESLGNKRIDDRDVPLEIIPYINKINSLIGKVFDSERQAAELKVAKQLAHDIRSPLSALDVCMDVNTNFDDEIKRITKEAIKRIHDISNNLLNSSREENKLAKNHQVCTILSSIVSEKRVQFSNDERVNIEFIPKKEDISSFAKVYSSEFKTIISNLLNNSVEARRLSSINVNVSISSNEQNVIISIEDNGFGISKNDIPFIFNKGYTSKKINGNGLGLYHARECIRKLGGDIEVTSEVGVGTKMKIILIREDAPNSFVDKIVITKNTKLFIIDDELSIHDVWRRKFEHIKLENEIFYFTDPELLNINFLKEDNIHIFIDYEFVGNEKTGIDFIKQFNLHSKATLVTSHAEDEDIIKLCENNSVKLIGKSLLRLIDVIKSIETDYVLIDDDKLIHQLWKLEAKKKNIELDVFETVESFLESQQSYGQNVNVFVDSNLGNGKFGEDEAEKIFKAGFENIYLVTGKDPSEIKNTKWIKDIRGKRPNFEL